MTRTLTDVVVAAQAAPPQGGNPEWVQTVLLIALFLVVGVWLLERTARFALLPQDTPGTEPNAADRFDRVRGWVLVLVLEVEAALAVAGWLGIFA